MIIQHNFQSVKFDFQGSFPHYVIQMRWNVVNKCRIYQCHCYILQITATTIVIIVPTSAIHRNSWRYNALRYHLLANSLLKISDYLLVSSIRQSVLMSYLLKCRYIFLSWLEGISEKDWLRKRLKGRRVEKNVLGIGWSYSSIAVSFHANSFY